MGPGFAEVSWSPWICLLLICSATSLPLQQMYQRPLYKMSGGPPSVPKSQRQSHRALQQNYLHPFPGSESSTSVETPSVASTEFAKKGSSSPQSALSLPGYDTASSYKGAHAVGQVSTTMAAPEVNPIGQKHWEGYNLFQEPNFNHKADAVKGQKSMTPGVYMVPSWYSPVYESQAPTGKKNFATYNPVPAPTSPEGPSNGSPSGPDNREPTFNPADNWRNVWEALNPFNTHLAENPDEVSENWESFEQPPNVDSPTLEVPFASVKGSHHGTGKVAQGANVGGKVPPIWALYSPYYEPASSYESNVPYLPPTGVKGRHATNMQKGGVKGQSARRPDVKIPPSWAMYEFPPGMETSAVPEILPNGVKAKPATDMGINWHQLSSYEPPKYGTKGQSVARPDVVFPPSWAMYELPSSSETSSVPELPNGVKGTPPGKGKPAGNLGSNWKQPPIYKPSKGGVKGQSAASTDGNIPPTWGMYELPSSLEISIIPELPSGVVQSSPVKGNWQSSTYKHPSGGVKGQSAANGNIPSNWPFYGTDYNPTTPEVVTGGVKGQLPSDKLNQGWGTFYSLYESPTDAPEEGPASNPGANIKGWTPYKPSTGVGKGQSAMKANGNRSPNLEYSQVYHSIPSDPIKGRPHGAVKGQQIKHSGHISPNWEYSQAFESPIPSEPTKARPHGTVKGQQIHLGGNLSPNWRYYSQGFESPIPSEPTNARHHGAVKGQQIKLGGNRSPNWGYSQAFESPIPSDPVKGRPHGAVKGQQIKVGGNLSPNWSYYSQVLESPIPSYPVEARPHHPVKGQVKPVGDVVQSWSTYSSVGHPHYQTQISPVLPPVVKEHLSASGTNRPAWGKVDHPAKGQWRQEYMQSHKVPSPPAAKYPVGPEVDLNTNWGSYGLIRKPSDVDPGSVKQSIKRPSVPSPHKPSIGAGVQTKGPVKGRPANLGGNQYTNWPSYYSSVHVEPSSYSPPDAHVQMLVNLPVRTGEETSAPESGSLLGHGWTKVDPDNWHPMQAHKVPSPSGVQHGAAKEQSPANAGGDALPNWATYDLFNQFSKYTRNGAAQVETGSGESAGYKWPPVSSPSKLSTWTGVQVRQPDVKGKPANVRTNWASYGSTYGKSPRKTPSVAPVVSHGKLQESLPSGVENTPSEPGSHWPQQHMQSHKVPSPGVKFGAGKKQPPTSPGNQLYVNWAGYDQLPKYTPPVAPEITQQVKVNLPAMAKKGTSSSGSSNQGLVWPSYYSSKTGQQVAPEITQQVKVNLPAMAQKGTSSGSGNQGLVWPSYYSSKTGQQVAPEIAQQVNLPTMAKKGTSSGSGNQGLVWPYYYSKSGQQVAPEITQQVKVNLPAMAKKGTSSGSGNQGLVWPSYYSSKTGQQVAPEITQQVKVNLPTMAKKGTSSGSGNQGLVWPYYPSKSGQQVAPEITQQVKVNLPAMAKKGTSSSGSGNQGLVWPSYYSSKTGQQVAPEITQQVKVNLPAMAKKGTSSSGSGNQGLVWPSYYSSKTGQQVAPEITQQVKVNLPAMAKKGTSSSGSSNQGLVWPSYYSSKTGQQVAPEITQQVKVNLPAMAKKGTSSSGSSNLGLVWPSYYSSKSGHQVSIKDADTGNGEPSAKLPVLPNTNVPSKGGEGSPSASIPNWNSQKSSSSHKDPTGKGSMSSPEAEAEGQDAEKKKGVKTYIVQNRHGYQNERREFSRMQYFQNILPSIPSLGSIQNPPTKA